MGREQDEFEKMQSQTKENITNISKKYGIIHIATTNKEQDLVIEAQQEHVENIGVTDAKENLDNTPLDIDEPMQGNVEDEKTAKG